MNKRKNTTASSSYLGWMASLAVILLALWFWYWLAANQQFAIGKVIQVVPTGSSYSIVLLDNYISPAQQVAVPVEQIQELSSQPAWLVVFGREFLPPSDLLVGDEVYSNPVVSFLFVVSPYDWLNSIADLSLIALLIAGLLIFTAGYALQWSYALLVSVFLMTTVWHVAIVSQVMGHINFSNIELNIILILTTLFGLKAYHQSNKQGLSTRITSYLALVFLSVLYGVKVLAWLNIGLSLTMDWSIHPILAIISLIVIGWFIPVVVTSLFATYLLSQVFDASFVGTVILFMVTLLASLTLWEKKPMEAFRQAIKQPIQQHIHRAKKYWRNRQGLDIQGKITLAELLRQSKAN